MEFIHFRFVVEALEWMHYEFIGEETNMYEEVRFEYLKMKCC